MKKEDNIIMRESPEAASIQTVTGWVSSKGHFFGKEESMARYDGSTHFRCECGGIAEKGYTVCPDCICRSRNERFKSMPFKKWDGETPLVLFYSDQYFFDEDSIHDYCEDNECEISDLQLVICEPNYLNHVDVGYWDDVIPENMDDLPGDVSKALDALNNAIEKAGPISWSEGKYRTKIE